MNKTVHFPELRTQRGFCPKRTHNSSSKDGNVTASSTAIWGRTSEGMTRDPCEHPEDGCRNGEIAPVASGSWDFERQRKGHKRKGKQGGSGRKYCWDQLLMWVKAGKKWEK